MNFALPCKQYPLKEIIVDTEAALNRMDKETVDYVRIGMRKIISFRPQKPSKETCEMYDAIESLKQKDVYVLKADKGNSVVVVDRLSYDDAMDRMIADGPYVEVKDSANKIMNCDVFGGQNWKWKMLPSYSKIPRIKGLPKIHKDGNKYRPMVDNTLCYSYRLSKFLCAQYGKLDQFDNFSVKNSIQLTEKLRDVKLTDDEILVSFDITSYFTNVPVDKALICLQKWLDKQCIDPTESNALYELTKVCTEQCSVNTHISSLDRNSINKPVAWQWEIVYHHFSAICM